MMPLFHCEECHHEWEGQIATCDWCGAPGYILAKVTELEAMIKRLPAILEELKKRSGDER